MRCRPPGVGTEGFAGPGEGGVGGSGCGGSGSGTQGLDVPVFIPFRALSVFPEIPVPPESLAPR